MKFAPCFAFLLFLAFCSSCGQSTAEVVNKDVGKEATEKIAPVKEMAEKKSGEVVRKDESTDKSDVSNKKRGAEYSAPYTCVDHCENSGSAMPGKCRTCGKDYMKNENYVKSNSKG